MKKKSTQKETKMKKMISAKEFDEKFDKGEDLTPYLDMDNIRVNYPVHRINVDMTRDMLNKVDAEADKIGVPRTSLIKMWIADRLRQQSGT